MEPAYDVSDDAQNDLVEIWLRIAEDSVDLANRIEREFHELFASLAKMPRLGHRRGDLTKRSVLFFPMYSFVIVYQPDLKPIRILAVLRGKRDARRILRERS
jgi:plasmid stabilization system protein ParE